MGVNWPCKPEPAIVSKRLIRPKICGMKTLIFQSTLVVFTNSIIQGSLENEKKLWPTMAAFCYNFIRMI